MKTIRLFEAFSGIGSQYYALKNIAPSMGWKIESTGIIEWYVDAIVAYLAIHYPEIKLDNLQDFNFNEIANLTISRDSKRPTKPSPYTHTHTHTNYYLYLSKTINNNKFDITKTNFSDIPNDIDIFTYSFPCQDLSVQGKQKGMAKNANTRSGLLWEIERLLKAIKKNKPKDLPKYLLLENVKNITSIRHKDAYVQWINELNKIGYESKTYILNAKDFNSPQSRERVFCLSVRKDIKKAVNFEFPNFTQSNATPITLDSILEKEYDKKLNLSKLNKYKKTAIKKSSNGIKKFSLINYTNFHSEAYVYLPDGLGPTLTASGANSRIKILTDDNQIRMLSPKECFRYMGFKDEDYENVKRTNLLSDTKIIYVAGNSIVVNVLEAIFRSLKF